MSWYDGNILTIDAKMENEQELKEIQEQEWEEVEEPEEPELEYLPQQRNKNRAKNLRRAMQREKRIVTVKYVVTKTGMAILSTFIFWGPFAAAAIAEWIW